MIFDLRLRHPCCMIRYLFHMILLFVAVSALALLHPAVAACECGYMLTQTGQIYTHKFQNDFSHIPDTTDAINLTRSIPDWEIQEYNFTADIKTGILGKQNAMSSIWVKNGQLHLLQQAYPKNSTGPVKVAELQSRRGDFFHGSFRASYQVVTVAKATGGAVTGFFFYYDDNNETDIEVLTMDGTSTIHYTNHPSINSRTEDLIPGTTFAEQLKKPWTQFQEHRFDWIDGLTTYYEDNVPGLKMRKNVPTHGGRIILNVWADNGTWSGPPSTNDVYMNLEYVIIYFNTTASENGEDADFNKCCSFAGGPHAKGTICYVTDKEGVSSLNSPMSLNPPAASASERSRPMSVALPTMLVGISVLLLL